MPVRKKRTFEDYYPGFANLDAPFEIRNVDHNFGTANATATKVVLIAHSDIKIIKFKMSVDTALSLDGSNYWTIQAYNVTQDDNLLATADTFNKAQAVAAKTAYEITPDQNIYLRDGDVLELQLTKVSSGADLVGLYVETEFVVTGREATTTSTSTTTTTTSSSTTTTSSSTTTTSSSTTTTSSSTTTT